MGSVISNTSLRLFEFVNELFVAVASGVVGIVILASKGLSEAQYIRTIFVTTVTVGCLVYVFQSSEQIKPSPEKVVFITGCDSGLGFSLAQHISDLGFTVVAGCLKLSSKGAKVLREYGKVIVIELDITSDVNTFTAAETVSKYLESNQYELWALINNAGSMVFGEFEWLTQSLINQQININLCGTFRITKIFAHLLRRYKARIITITSHCAQATLPGLAVYGATKAGLHAWSDGIRVELGKYGIKVVTFIPGSFVPSSNILSKQDEHVHEMSSAFTNEQKKFYGDYFKRYNAYLSAIPTAPNKPMRIEDPDLYKQFEKALMVMQPKAMYIHENWRYKIFHTIFKYSPTAIRDYFIVRFMQMPDYNTERYVPNALA